MVRVLPVSSNLGQAHPSPEEFVVVGGIKYCGWRFTSNNVEIGKSIYDSSPIKTEGTSPASFISLGKSVQHQRSLLSLKEKKHYGRKDHSHQVELKKKIS